MNIKFAPPSHLATYSLHILSDFSQVIKHSFKYKKTSKTYSSQKGFSLIETMVVLVIMSIVSLGFMTMINNQQKGANLIEARLSELEVIREITNFLSDPESCKNTLTFKGSTPIAQEVIPDNTARKRVLTIRDKNNVRIMNSGSVGGALDKIIKIEGMELLSSKTGTPSPTFSNPDATGVAYLKIKLNRKKLPESGIKRKDHFISLILKTDSTKKAIECSARSENTPAISSLCDPGEVLTGFTSNGEAVCSDATNPCEEGTVLSIDASGNFTCIPNATTYIYAFHSQTTNSPNCPQGMTSLWTGYSFLGTGMYGGRSDLLAKPGSCINKSPNQVKTFICWQDNYCYKSPSYAQYSMWLSGSSDSVTTKSASRCRVCIGAKPILSFHSYSESKPSCPSGWTSQWTGYSFQGWHYHNQWGTATSDINSPGSCLRQKRKDTAVTCSSSTNCSVIYGANYSTKYFHSNTTQSLADTVNTIDGRHISRCRVCMKD